MFRRKSYPYAGLDWSTGFQEFETSSIFIQSAHERRKAVSPKHRPPLTPKSPDTNLCHKLSRPGSHSKAENLKDLIWNETRDLWAYSAVPKPTELPRTLLTFRVRVNLDALKSASS
jgi:hypothetical protein